jgi:hypothetical protein
LRPDASAIATRSSTFAARGGQHDFDIVGRIGGRADHVEVEADFVERERNVLAGFGLDLHFQLVFRQPGRQDDLLGDHRGGRHAQRHVPGARAALLPHPAHRFHHLVHVLDIAVGDSVARQRFGGVALQPVIVLADLRQLHQPHAGGADVDAHQRRVALAQQGLEIDHTSSPSWLTPVLQYIRTCGRTVCIKETRLKTSG